MSKINGASGSIRYSSFETGSSGASKSSLGQKSKTFEPSQPTSNNTASVLERMSVRQGIDSNSLKARLNSTYAARTASRASANNDFPTRHVPPNKRHKYGNKYDTVPTSRPAGDPDRYRAINKESGLVNYRNGKPYFKINVKPDTHLFDRQSLEKGAIVKGNVEIDFSRTKIKRLENGKKERYVYAIKTDENNNPVKRGYVRESSLTQSKKKIKEGDAFKFPLKQDGNGTGPQMVDGNGVARGNIVPKEVKINYGQKRIINGEPHYYAFATKINNIPGAASPNDKQAASGWIKAKDIKGEIVPFGKKAIEDMKLPPAKLSSKTYEITGGDEMPKDGKNKFGYTRTVMKDGERTTEFVSYKVMPRTLLKKSVKATDYLMRPPGDVVNLGFNAAGVSNDSFKIDPKKPLYFQRAEGKGTTITIDLYHPKDKNHAGEKPVGKMTFVYGCVLTDSGKRWGWMALDALKPKTAPPPSA